VETAIKCFFEESNPESGDDDNSKQQSTKKKEKKDINYALPTIDGLVISGAAELKTFLPNELDARLKNILVCDPVDIGAKSDFGGVLETLKKTKEKYFMNGGIKSLNAEKDVLREFFEEAEFNMNAMKNDTSGNLSRVCYGIDSTMTALTDWLCADKIVVSSELDILRREVEVKYEVVKKDEPVASCGDKETTSSVKELDDYLSPDLLCDTTAELDTISHDDEVTEEIDWNFGMDAETWAAYEAQKRKEEEDDL